MSVLHDSLLLAVVLSHLSSHSALLRRAKAFAVSACLRLLISKGMFRKRYCSFQLSQKRSPCRPLLKLGLELIPSLFLLHFRPSWLNQAIILKGNFKLFVTPPLPHPTPRPPPPPQEPEKREQSPWIRVICF